MIEKVYDRTLETPDGPYRVVGEIVVYPERDGFFYPRVQVTHRGVASTEVPHRHPLDGLAATASAGQFAQAKLDHMRRCLRQPGVTW